jgi:hypothetical protein
MQIINCEKIRSAFSSSAWDLSNDILYKMCRQYPNHENDEEIIAKILIIGRVYSAAIERRKEVKNNSDAFYIKEVAPKIRKSKIDEWFRTLNGLERPTRENCVQIIAVHKKVTNLFEKISGLEKRSLASKYLHFHFPKIFFIYDARSSRAINQVEPNLFIWHPIFEKYDHTYARFFLRCMNFAERINSQCGVYLTPRQLDKYLLSLK